MRNELARTPADALLRRLDLPWWECGGQRCRESWAKAFAVAGMDEATIDPLMTEWERELTRDWRR